MIALSALIAPLAALTPSATAPRRAIGPENRNLVIAQILEEGDRADLAWLAASDDLAEHAVALGHLSGYLPGRQRIR